MNVPAVMSTAAINNALALRFPKLSHALLWEVAPGHGSTYADAVAVGLWASHGHMIQGIEVKASRSDFQKEMAHPEKSEPVMRFCHRWWRACPKGMVKPDEIPPTWGMLELVGDVLRVKVKAPLLKPVPPTLAFFASLCRRRSGGDDEMYERRVAAEVTARVEREIERQKRSQSNQYSHRVTSAEEASKRFDEIKAATGIDLTEHKCQDDIIAAIKAYRAVKGDWRDPLVKLRELHTISLAALDKIEFFQTQQATP
jgi:hypothetical protein